MSENKPKDVDFGDNKNFDKPREAAVKPADNSDKGIAHGDKPSVSHAE